MCTKLDCKLPSSTACAYLPQNIDNNTKECTRDARDHWWANVALEKSTLPVSYLYALSNIRKKKRTSMPGFLVTRGPTDEAMWRRKEPKLLVSLRTEQHSKKSTPGSPHWRSLQPNACMYCTWTCSKFCSEWSRSLTIWKWASEQIRTYC